MPRIPTLDNQARLGPLQPARPQFTPSTGLESLGSALGDVAETFQKVQQQEQLKADRAAFMEADRKLGTAENSLLFDPEKGAFNRKGKDTFGLAPSVLSDFDKQASEIEQSLSTDRQKRVFRESLVDRRVDIERQLNRHEAQEREGYYAGEREAYKETAQAAAANFYNNPSRIDKEISRIRSVVDQTPGISQAEKDAEFAKRASDTYTDVIARYIANNDSAGAGKYFDAVKDRLLPDAANRVSAAIETAKDRKKALAVKAAVDARSSAIMRVYEADGPEAGAAALASLQRSGLPQDVVRDIYRNVQADRAMLRDRLQQENADALTAIQSDILNKTTDAGSIQAVDDLWKAGAFTVDEYTSLLGRIESSQLAGAEEAAAAAEIRNALQSGFPLDPSNDKHRKALSASFEQDTKGVQVGSPSWLAAAEAYAVRTRMLPSQATAWTRQALRSPNPKFSAEAAQFVASVDAAAGDAVTGFDADTKALAGLIGSMVNAGTDPKEAVQIARERVIDANPAQIKARSDAYSVGANALGKNSTAALKDFIDRDMDTWLTAQPEPTQALDLDFRQLAEKYFVRVGDIDLAHELAWKDLRRVYGVSEVNGQKQVIAFPPERFGISTEDVRSDIGAFLQKHPQADGSTVDDIIIVPDALTLRQVNNIADGAAVSPSYRMVTKSGDVVVNADGVPQRYTLPSGNDLAKRITEAQEAAKRGAQESIDQARANREAARRRADWRKQGERW